MLPSESPFQYKYGRFRPFPFELHGDFAWIKADKKQYRRNISSNAQFQPSPHYLATLPHLLTSEEPRVQLPGAFTTFMKDVTLQECFRSATDCYLDLSPAPFRSPIRNGYLVRFLADSQGTRYWYLYLNADGSDHAVVSSDHFCGTEAEMQSEPEYSEPTAFGFIHESFEVFMCGFWLANEVDFHSYESPKSKATFWNADVWDSVVEWFAKKHRTPQNQISALKGNDEMLPNPNMQFWPLIPHQTNENAYDFIRQNPVQVRQVSNGAIISISDIAGGVFVVANWGDPCSSFLLREMEQKHKAGKLVSFGILLIALTADEILERRYQLWFFDYVWTLAPASIDLERLIARVPFQVNVGADGQIERIAEGKI